MLHRQEGNYDEAHPIVTLWASKSYTHLSQHTNRCWLLTSTFNLLCQYASSAGSRDYCHHSSLALALAVTIYCQYSLCPPTEDGQDWLIV